MKYMLLIYNNPDNIEAMSEDEREASMSDVDSILAELAASGEMVGGEALAHPSTAKTVRVVDGVPEATDGPYVGAKEMLAGYLTIEADSVERAVQIASRWPDARHGAMEVRAVMHPGGMEM
ncbi:YciI family protein [Catenulispora rubra]|uniref:YciI family protein n=1 Tax=Catenulispora rubra TaxID=280293 RepID=UPI0018921BEB